MYVTLRTYIVMVRSDVKWCEEFPFYLIKLVSKFRGVFGVRKLFLPGHFGLIFDGHFGILGLGSVLIISHCSK